MVQPYLLEIPFTINLICQLRFEGNIIGAWITFTGAIFFPVQEVRITFIYRTRKL